METKLRVVRNFKASDGGEPFEEWVDRLKDEKVQAIVFERLNRVRLGNFGDCRHLLEGIYELRIHYGQGYRVYFGQLGKIIIILLCGGSKGTQKRDIKRVKMYWQELNKKIYE